MFAQLNAAIDSNNRLTSTSLFMLLMESSALSSSVFADVARCAQFADCQLVPVVSCTSILYRYPVRYQQVYLGSWILDLFCANSHQSSGIISQQRQKWTPVLFYQYEIPSTYLQ